jgi:hypothetical protein
MWNWCIRATFKAVKLYIHTYVLTYTNIYTRTYTHVGAHRSHVYQLAARINAYPILLIQWAWPVLCN